MRLVQVVCWLVCWGWEQTHCSLIGGGRDSSNPPPSCCRREGSARQLEAFSGLAKKRRNERLKLQAADSRRPVRWWVSLGAVDKYGPASSHTLRWAYSGRGQRCPGWASGELWCNFPPFLAWKQSANNFILFWWNTFILCLFNLKVKKSHCAVSWEFSSHSTSGQRKYGHDRADCDADQGRDEKLQWQPHLQGLQVGWVLPQVWGARETNRCSWGWSWTTYISGENCHWIFHPFVWYLSLQFQVNVKSPEANEKFPVDLTIRQFR